MIYALRNAMRIAQDTVAHRHVHSTVSGVDLQTQYGIPPELIREHEEVLTGNQYRDVSVRSYRFAQLCAEVGVRLVTVEDTARCSTATEEDGTLVFRMDKLFGLQDADALRREQARSLLAMHRHAQAHSRHTVRIDLSQVTARKMYHLLTVADAHAVSRGVRLWMTHPARLTSIRVVMPRKVGGLSALVRWVAAAVVPLKVQEKLEFV